MNIYSLSDWWIGRKAAPQPKALQAIRGLTPVVAITGGSRGIGRAIAVRFANAGHRVMLIGRHEGDLIAAARKLADVSPTNSLTEPIILAADVTDPDAAQRIDSALAARGCYLDILVNNAGMGLSGEFVAQDVGALDDLVEVNVAAVTRLTRHALSGMLTRGSGGIINVASLGGLMPGPYQAAYYASKAYVISLTYAVAFENGGRGVRVSCVLPGPVETEFHAEMGANNALYRYFVPSLSPEAVAASVYRGYRLGHRMIVPGPLNWMTSRIVGLIPYAVLVPLVGFLLGMGAKNR
jgi:uncharacterized protein